LTPLTEHTQYFAVLTCTPKGVANCPLLPLSNGDLDEEIK
jgi:hypothetical protein